MLELFSQPNTYISLLSLSLMEVVLGIDNIIFVSIIADKLPIEQKNKARILGLILAVVARLLLLFCISWLMGLTAPLFTIDPLNLHLSGKDLILLVGGLFLIWKSSKEIFDKIEGHPESLAANNLEANKPKKSITFQSVIIQILIIDTIFSIDSIITAVGMVDHLIIMVLAILISSVIMVALALPIGNFIDKHPSIKILALSFLIMIGTMLVADAFGKHIPKGYIYFSLVYALAIEFINLKLKDSKKK